MRSIFLAFLLTACSNRPDVTPPLPPPESFEDALFRTEGVRCADVTAHADHEPPDCEKLVAAFKRGRARVAHVYPQAAAFQMSLIYFWRPPRVTHPSKPYPLMIGSDGDIKRGEFNPGMVPLVGFAAQVMYSYEEIAEHETVHVLTWLSGGPWANACHGTPDDPYNVSPFTPARCAEVAPSETIG